MAAHSVFFMNGLSLMGRQEALTGISIAGLVDESTARIDGDSLAERPAHRAPTNGVTRLPVELGRLHGSAMLRPQSGQIRLVVETREVRQLKQPRARPTAGGDAQHYPRKRN
jgi:hypothetical protein